VRAVGARPYPGVRIAGPPAPGKSVHTPQAELEFLELRPTSVPDSRESSFVRATSAVLGPRVTPKRLSPTFHLARTSTNIMKHWIKLFLNDERGAESTELAITGVVVAGGSVAGFTELKDKIEAKGDELIGKLDAATGN